MATHYARNVTGAWADANSWSDTDGGGAGTTYPVAGDTAIMNATSGAGTITLGAAAACLNLTMTGYTGTLALVSYNITIGAGGSLSYGGTVSTTTGVIVFG